jgi:hypothetical protein
VLILIVRRLLQRRRDSNDYTEMPAASGFLFVYYLPHVMTVDTWHTSRFANINTGPKLQRFDNGGRDCLGGCPVRLETPTGRLPLYIKSLNPEKNPSP